MSLSKIFVDLLEFCIFVVELIDFFDHSQLFVTVEIEILLYFFALFAQSIVQDLDFVFIVPFDLFDLDSPRPFVEFILVGELLE